jgi:hypothetical protein
MTAEIGTIFSVSGDHRYTLARRWRPGPLVLFVGLNPSTADDVRNDATVTRMTGFAQREGFGGLLLGNLYALRSTDPDALLTADEPVGPDNDEYRVRMSRRALMTVCCWGGHRAVAAREPHVVGLLERAGAFLFCLGKTQGGQHPKHPVRLRGDTPLEPYGPRWATLPLR